MIPLSGFFRILAVGGGATLLSLIVVKSMAFLNSVIAARLLGPYEYGAYSVILNLQNLVTIVACLGIPLSLAKFIAHHRNSSPDIAEKIGSYLMTMLLVSSAVVSGLYLIFAHTIAVTIYGDEGLTVPIQLSSLIVLLSSVNLGLTSSVQGCKEITKLARVNAAVAIAAQPIALVMIMGYGLEGAILALAVSTSVSVGLLLSVLRKTLPIHLAFRGHRRGKDERSITYSFTIPSFLSSLMIVPAFWFGRTILAVHADFDSVGSFQVAESLSQFMLLIPAAVSAPLLPLVSEMHAENSSKVGESSRSLLAIVMFFVIPLAILALPALETVIRILYGGEYSEATSLATLMFVSSALAAVSTVMSTVVIGTGRMWAAFGMNAVWTSCFFASTIALVPLNDAEGLAAAYLLSHLVYLVVLMAYFGRVYGVRIGLLPLPVIVLLSYTAFYYIFLSGQDSMTFATLSVAIAVTTAAATGALVLESREREMIRKVIRYSHLRRRGPRRQH